MRAYARLHTHPSLLLPFSISLFLSLSLSPLFLLLLFPLSLLQIECGAFLSSSHTCVTRIKGGFMSYFTPTNTRSLFSSFYSLFIFLFSSLFPLSSLLSYALTLCIPPSPLSPPSLSHFTANETIYFGDFRYTPAGEGTWTPYTEVLYVCANSNDISKRTLFLSLSLSFSP